MRYKIRNVAQIIIYLMRIVALFICDAMLEHRQRMGGRAVECTGLENRHG